jgi:hypothetical protein
MEDFGDILIILLFVAGSIISAVVKAFKGNKTTRPLASSPSAPNQSIPNYEDPFNFDIEEEKESQIENKNVVKQERLSDYNFDERFNRNSSLFNEGSRITTDTVITKEKAFEPYKKPKPHPILRGVNISDAIIYSEIFKTKF